MTELELGANYSIRPIRGTWDPKDDGYPHKFEVGTWNNGLLIGFTGKWVDSLSASVRRNVSAAEHFLKLQISSTAEVTNPKVVVSRIMRRGVRACVGKHSKIGLTGLTQDHKMS